jgi:GNAT superfamily N-acetyltransferase
MILKGITKDDRPIIEQWLQNDLAGHQFVAYYRDTTLIFKLLSPTRKFWLAYDNEVAIGFVDLEINLPKGYFTFYVAPEFRSKGLSQELLNLLEQQAKKFSIVNLLGYIETDNSASIRSLQKASYIQSEQPDKDGLLEFDKKLT